jgi:ABC-2 type transport system permease protein
MGLFFGFGGIAGAAALGSGAYYFVSHGRAQWMAVLFWPVFLFWQLFPVMATAFSEALDPSTLLRFPLSYRSYFLVRIAYGSLDVSTALGLLWLSAIGIGVGIAKPALLPWAILVGLGFALVNISLARLVFAWVERWLAQRKTREIFGVVVLLLALSGQLIGPLLSRYGRRTAPHAAVLAQELSPEQRLLPPGAAGASLAGWSNHSFANGLGYFLLLCAYGGVFLWLLHLRLYKQFRGENLSETSVRNSPLGGRPLVRPSWNLAGLSAPVAAVFEKEFRYLLRSGPMLFTLLVPGFMLLIFRLGPGGSREAGQFLTRAPNLAFPVGAAYSLLLLTNLVYNTFGADGSGLQMFFASPVSFRQIVAAKNLSHAAVLVFEVVLVWVAVSFFFKPPTFAIAMATLTGIAFAAPVNFLAGNLLSLYAPKKVDYGALGRQRASQTGVLVSFGVQLAVFSIGGAVLYLSRQVGGYWAATVFFLVLAALAWTAYLMVMQRIDDLAVRQQEALLGELSRS